MTVVDCCLWVGWSTRLLLWVDWNRALLLRLCSLKCLSAFYIPIIYSSHICIWLRNKTQNISCKITEFFSTWLTSNLIKIRYLLHLVSILLFWRFTITRQHIVWGHVKVHIFNRPISDDCRAPTTLKSEGEVTSLSGADKGEVRDYREKWWEYREKSKYFSNCTTFHIRGALSWHFVCYNVLVMH